MESAHVMFIKPKRYIQLTSILLLLLTGCSNVMSDNVKKFEWDATESGPEHYPMEIIKGDFIYKGGAERGLYIPSGGTLVDGWADPVSSHVTGDKYKPLPDKLDIYFFSYAEKQFYHGKFDLPYEKILRLFQQGVTNNPEHPTASRIMVGVAPGGAVAVWVIGSGDRTEVFFGQAKKTELNPSVAFSLPFENKAESDEYIEEGLIEVLEPEELESLKKNGIPFGLWARYRNHYTWEPALTEGFSLSYIGFKFLNGERYKKSNMLSRPVPKEIAFKTVINNEENIFIIKFDEFEVMEAFEKLGVNNQKVTLEFEPIIPRKLLKARIYNGKESITLKKIVSKDW